jgi:hypothetical protein
MRISSVICFLIVMSACESSKSRQFTNYLVGDWRIENPSMQSFIRFEENGKTTYYLNRYSYKLDSLAEYGDWRLKEIKKGTVRDTFVVQIDKRPQQTTFQFIPIDQQRIKVIDERGQTFFTRIEKNQ